MKNSGVQTFDQHAKVIDEHTVELASGEQFTSEYILLATGGKPDLPNIPGIDHVLTSDEIFSLSAVPQKLLIVGGGYIACEFASIFTGLGSKVTQFCRGETILRGFDSEATALVANQMKSNGVDLQFGANVVKGATQRALRSGALRTAGKVAGGVGRAAGFVGTAAAGLSTVADLKKQIVDRQEGFGSFGKLAKAIAEDNKKANQGSRGRSQAKKDNDNKPKKESKPSRTTSGGNTNRRGRRITSSSSKPSSSKPRVSNIPKSEGTGKEAETKLGYGAGAKKPPTKPSVTRTAKKKPSIKEAAYAKDSRNREYDRLRKAGKTKEAEALGRKIAGMKPKEVKETQKRTGGSRIANITLPKKEPEKKSAARKAGYQGSRLY